MNRRAAAGIVAPLLAGVTLQATIGASGAGAFQQGGSDPAPDSDPSGLPAETAAAAPADGEAGQPPAPRTYAAAYYFPNFHRDRRNDVWYGPGWTEWELVKVAQPRFPGHEQPVTPAWGYFDEASPAWAARQIDLAANHGLDAFLFDWYWYEDGAYLQGALEDGFLAAPNSSRLKFALMWANHDWCNIQPAYAGKPFPELMPGALSAAGFERLTDYVVTRYFRQPNYLTLDGQPYFSIYDLATFITGLGGVAEAREALARFRAKAQRAGFPDLHLNGIVWGRSAVQPAAPAAPAAAANPAAPTASQSPQTPSAGRSQVVETVRLAEALGLTSIGSYTWVHHQDPTWDGFPQASYALASGRYARWLESCRGLPIRYHANATVGWDSSPRTAPSDSYEPRGYPWFPVLQGNTPALFEEGLVRAKAYAERTAERAGAGERLVTINAWNEWTEGSYLLPDARHGTAYLEALRRVFGSGSANPEPAIVKT